MNDKQATSSLIDHVGWTRDTQFACFKDVWNATPKPKVPTCDVCGLLFTECTCKARKLRK